MNNKHTIAAENIFGALSLGDVLTIALALFIVIYCIVMTSKEKRQKREEDKLREAVRQGCSQAFLKKIEKLQQREAKRLKGARNASAREI